MTAREQMRVGLLKLEEASQGLRELQVQLERDEEELAEADAACAEVLESLEERTMEAKRERSDVLRVRQDCEERRARTSGERDAAESDLARAKPFLDAANDAVNSIRPQDIQELRAIKTPKAAIKLVLDAVAVLLREPLLPTLPVVHEIGQGRGDVARISHIADSFELHKRGMVARASFLRNIMTLSHEQRDCITDEDIELLEPYTELSALDDSATRNASFAALGLLKWARAMRRYYLESKVVYPKLAALKDAEARLSSAEMALSRAEKRLRACEDEVALLQRRYEKQMEGKTAIEKRAQALRDRASKAQGLLDALAGERTRWTEGMQSSALYQASLVADCSVAAFLVVYASALPGNAREAVLGVGSIESKRMADVAMNRC